MDEELQGQPQSGTESQTDPTTPVPGDPGYSDFYSGLLRDAPEEHRSIIEPYIKRFDAGVQRRFQDLHSQLKPYKELGWDDEDNRTAAAELYRLAQEDPRELLQRLQSYLESQETPPTGGGAGNVGTESYVADPEVPGGIPPEIQERLDEQQRILEAVANVLTAEHTSKQQAAEDAEFENDLQLLRNEFGDFDESYVLARFIHNDVPLDQAIKEWQGKIQEEVNKAASATSGLPRRVLSNAGGGAVPQPYQQNLGELQSKDIRNLVANVLANVNKE